MFCIWIVYVLYMYMYMFCMWIVLKGRDNYGVFPLKGKLLNVRDASKKQLLNNAEVQNIMKIMGLKLGMVYEDLSKLRYGKLHIFLAVFYIQLAIFELTLTCNI